MTPYETRLLELVDRLQAALEELREAVQQGPAEDPRCGEAVEAFADETFRARDA